MIDKNIRALIKEQIGITDEGLDKVSPGYSKLISGIPELIKWNIIAEVTESRYCSHVCKTGDKIFFSGHAVNAEQSTCPLCLGALASLQDCLHIMWGQDF